MITAKLILRQWQGVLGYEILSCQPNQTNISGAPLPEDILKQLLQAGLDMYIRRYLITTVWHPPAVHGQKVSVTPSVEYHPNPHYRDQPLYITTADNTLYELEVCFDYLAPSHVGKPGAPKKEK